MPAVVRGRQSFGQCEFVISIRYGLCHRWVGVEDIRHRPHSLGRRHCHDCYCTRLQLQRGCLCQHPFNECLQSGLSYSAHMSVSLPLTDTALRMMLRRLKNPARLTFSLTIQTRPVKVLAVLYEVYTLPKISVQPSASHRPTSSPTEASESVSFKSTSEAELAGISC